MLSGASFDPSASSGQAKLRTNGKPANDRGGSPFKQGPRNRLSRAAGAAAPEGLEPAVPKLLEQLWTGDRGEASRELRPARPRELHAVSDRGGSSYQQGPRVRPWPVLSLAKGRPAGAAAPSGGRELHAVSDRGGNIPFKQGPRVRLCRPAGAAAPSGGRELREANDRGGNISRPPVFHVPGGAQAPVLWP